MNRIHRFFCITPLFLYCFQSYSVDVVLSYLDYFRLLDSKNVRVSTALLSTQLIGKPSSSSLRWGGIDVDYNQWISRHWGFSVGMRYGSISSSFRSNRTQSVSFVDIQGQPYDLSLKTNTKERLLMNNVAIPIMVSYRHPLTSSLDFEMSMGFSLGYLLNLDYRMVSGSFSRLVWYKDLNILIDDIPQKQLGKFNSFAPATSVQGVRLNTNAHFNLSFRYDLSRLNYKPFSKFYLIGGVKSEMSLDRMRIQSKSMDISTSPYYGELVNGNSSYFRTFSYGVFIGFSYTLGERYRGSELINSRKN